MTGDEKMGRVIVGFGIICVVVANPKKENE